MKNKEKHLSQFYVQNFCILVTDQLHAYSIIILTYLNLGTDQEVSHFYSYSKGNFTDRNYKSPVMNLSWPTLTQPALPYTCSFLL